MDTEDNFVRMNEPLLNKPDQNGFNKKRVAAYTVVAGAASLALWGGASAYSLFSERPPLEIDFDTDGNEMRLVKFDAVPEGQNLLQTYDEVTEENAASVLLSANVFPYAFWTANHAPDKPAMSGVAPGDDYLVFKSW